MGGSWDLSLSVRIICKEGTKCRVLKAVPGNPKSQFHSLAFGTALSDKTTTAFVWTFL